MNDLVIPIFLLMLGLCLGSFLNVVIWRLPREESLVSPPSHCPKCDNQIAWYENLPIMSYVFLHGRCHHCGVKIPLRYPLVELLGGIVVVGSWAAMTHGALGPQWTAPADQVAKWFAFGAIWFMLLGLLAASVIDGEMYLIPLGIPWAIAIVGVAYHGVFDRPGRPFSLLSVDEGGQAGILSAVSGGMAVGLLLAWVLRRANVLPTSFVDGEPEPGTEVEGVNLRTEMLKELGFTAFPLVLGAAALAAFSMSGGFRSVWREGVEQFHLGGVLGALLGAITGAMLIWITRILGSLALGKSAMGLGDVHLMFAIGAVLGAPAAILTFFLAPFAGLAVGVWMLIFGKGRMLPYGPYLSLAAAAVLFYEQSIFQWLGILG